MELTRRKFFRNAAAASGLGAVVLFESSCSATGLVAALDLVSAGIDSVIPILSMALPQYGPVLALIGTLLSDVTAAVGKTSTVLSQNLPILQQAQQIEAAWAGIVLDPSVISQLPNTQISANNTNTVQGIVRLFIQAVNNFLSAVASEAGAVAVLAPNNAIVIIQGLAKAAASKMKSARIPLGARFTIDGVVNRRHLSEVRSRAAAQALKISEARTKLKVGVDLKFRREAYSEAAIRGFRLEEMRVGDTANIRVPTLAVTNFR